MNISIGNVNIQQFIGGMITNMNLVQMNLSPSQSQWLNKIPDKPGWYSIETDAPLNVLQTIGTPQLGKNYDIPKRITHSIELRNQGLANSIHKGGFYFIYNGMDKNSLRRRANEHAYGHAQTICLSLSQYKILHSYTWIFYCCTGEALNIPIDKGILIFGEQLWRSVYGWPILCMR